MKRVGTTLSWALLLAAPVAAKRLATAPEKVVELLTELEANIKADGVAEQTTYDKYACWCENTLSRKAKDISSAKDTAEALQTSITKLKGELGAHGAEIQQLKKDIAANLDSQRSAAEMRAKESEAFEAEKTEAEQCIGALGAAITVLTNSGTKKSGFLETMQEAQVLSVVAGVRSVLRNPMVSRSASDEDLGIVRRFVERPEDFMGSRAGVLSAAQIANNPFGDYAPQSTQIQGILKSMHDTFTENLAKSTAEEAKRLTSFQELSAMKQSELETLKTTLAKQTLDEATKTKLASDNKKVLDDTRAQISADEKFFTEAKTSCKAKAGEFAERTRLRTEELHGVATAISILTSDEAKKLFGGAAASFVQLRAVTAAGRKQQRARVQAADRLRALAHQFKSVEIAKIAVQVRSGGHFDAVIASIERMVAVLRDEEQSDIKHRDRCQAAQTKNTNSMEDLNSEIEKTTKALERMADQATQLQGKITALESDIDATKADIASLAAMRATEHDEFLKAQKDGADTVKLLEEAIVSLSSFFKANNIPLSLVSVKNDPAPETWSSGGYGGRQGENRGIIAILSMIKEDMEKDLTAGSQDEESAQKVYAKDRQGLQNTLEKQTASKLATESELADLQGKVADKNSFKGRKETDLGGEEAIKSALEADCSWVETHFQTRRDNRKKEIDGLIDAKGYLAGMA